MKDLKAVRGTKLLQNLIAQGENETQDFKFAVNDPRKIARSISAFANNSGGRLLIGVKDNGTVAGVPNEEDIYIVEQAALSYCHPPQKIDFAAYRYQDDRHVIVATIAPAHDKPVYVIEDKDLKKAYFRVNDQNIAADALITAAWKTQKSAVALSQQHFSITKTFTPGIAMTPRQVALKNHIPTPTALALMADLIAAGVLRCTHNGTQFAAVTEPGDNTL